MVRYAKTVAYLGTLVGYASTLEPEYVALVRYESHCEIRSARKTKQNANHSTVNYHFTVVFYSAQDTKDFAGEKS